MLLLANSVSGVRDNAAEQSQRTPAIGHILDVGGAHDTGVMQGNIHEELVESTTVPLRVRPGRDGSRATFPAR